MIRAQLEKMLASDLFARSERLSMFLRFVVEQTMEGHSAALKEQTLGSRLYRDGGEFDGAADPIVRVDARRLRDKLREYYSEFPHDPVLISLPKGTYVPVFQPNPAAAPAEAPERAGSGRGRERLGRLPAIARMGLVLALLAGATFVISKVRRQPPDARAKLVRITAFPGHVSAPSLSPDGRFVAFSWKGPDESAKRDIWVKSLEGTSLRRLTDTAAASETEAAWSPDGRDIAFVRDGEGVFVVAASGGGERKVSGSGTHVGWTPDSQSLLIRDRAEKAAYSVYQVFLDGRQRRRLTEPPSGIGDWRFCVSPDGKRLAFIRYERTGVGDLFVVSMRGGTARRLTDWNGILDGVAWSPDGRDIVYSAAGLWRIPADTMQPGRGVLVPGAPATAMDPSLAPAKQGRRARLAFRTRDIEASMRIIDLKGPLKDGVLQNVKPFAAASRLDYPGLFSPDSRSIAFVSARDETLPKLTGGMPELWISGLDGAGLRKLHAAPHLSLGGWSRDGRIVYDCAAGGNSDVYVIDISSGTTTRLTFEPSIEAIASWSHDDRWIYFTSTRDSSWNKPDIWRIPAGGGPAARITFHGGFRPIESADGRYLYYADRPPPDDGGIGKSRLMRKPAGGGEEVSLFSGLTPFWWSVTEAGIFFLARDSQFDAVNRYDPATARVTLIGRLSFRARQVGRFIVSPDGRWAIAGTERTEEDLMFLDGFQ